MPSYMGDFCVGGGRLGNAVNPVDDTIAFGRLLASGLGWNPDAAAHYQCV
jgi:hypothetical protein